MGTTVRLLDESLIDQIAAGEVIERPANLVKELLENAIDAQATSIAVTVEDGGRALVRVRDDGSGMSRPDAQLAIQRHATSKIRTFDDLTRVRTLGFRGEALPSIGAVSRMTIRTRRPEDVEGTHLVIEGGKLQRVEPCGCPAGTSVEVEDLFYNVPARRKFLRARQTETSKIMEICQRTALIRPELRLEASSEGRTTRSYPPVTGLLARAYQAFGDQPFDEIVAEQAGLAVHAVFARISQSRPGARHLFVYVNGRPIVDRRIAHAVAFAYGDRLPRGHYPRGIVSLGLSAEEVDVNAHPQKTEVRFRQASRVVDTLSRIVGSRIRGGTTSRIQSGTHRRPVSDATSPARVIRGTPATSDTSQVRVSETPSPYMASPAEGRLIAQLRGRYLLCDDGSRIVLVDRAQADAALTFEALVHSAASGPLPPQALLFPDRLDLDAKEQATLDAHDEVVSSLGFEWSAIGDTSFALRAVPAALGTASARRSFVGVLHALGKNPGVGREGLLRLLAEARANAPGIAVTQADAAALAARLDFDRPAHRATIVAELKLPHDDEESQ